MDILSFHAKYIFYTFAKITVMLKVYDSVRSVGPRGFG